MALAPVNSSFHPDLTNLQIAWDSTSSGAFKTCPRYYQYTIIEGWVSSRQQVHLEFGILIHKGLEIYDHARIVGGLAHEDALDVVVAWAMMATWNKALKRPWTTESSEKNRFTLLRSLVWYLDQFQDEASKVVVLANGKPAVELSFRLELDLAPLADAKSPFLHCGHMDRLVELNGEVLIRDVKSTGNTLDDNYFAQFTPDAQFSGYLFAGKVALQAPVSGIMVDAIQVAVGFSRFMRRIIPRTDAQLQEWYQGLTMMLRQAEVYARMNFWPMNEKACFRCAFREICSKSPSVREQWLKGIFRKRVWDPLKTRGDI